MGLLSGLGGMGLGNLEGMSLYEDVKKPQKVEADVDEQAKEETRPTEIDYIFEKGYECPVCVKKFKSFAVMTGKARLSGTDEDLKPNYVGIEPIKYDVVVCPNCGYAALTKNWGGLTPTQIKNIKLNIASAFKPKAYGKYMYTFDEAAERYQLALATAIVKQAKASEKAYICLKAGWLQRAKMESLDPSSKQYELEYAEAENLQNEYLKKAKEGFVASRQNESFPICGMDESTLDYLLATMFIRFEEYENAAKLVGQILASRTANSRIKDRARDLKDIIIEKVKK